MSAEITALLNKWYELDIKLHTEEYIKLHRETHHALLSSQFEKEGLAVSEAELKQLARDYVIEDSVNQDFQPTAHRAFVFGFKKCQSLSGNEELKKKAAAYDKLEVEDREFTMLKSWFVFTGEGNERIGLTECPSCGDSVVYGDGCVKCTAVFNFK